MNVECLFNPLVRSYCEPCREQKAKCSNAFKLPTDHCMATYLGYAIFRMVSDPSTYVEPTFSPTHLPTPLPTNIDWFRVLYEKARGKTNARTTSHSAPPDASHSVVGDASNSHPPPLPLAVPRTALKFGGGTALKSRSRSVSYAPSGVSSTIPGSSTVSVEEPPPSPSAASEASHETPADVPLANRARSSSNHGPSGGSSGGMSVDGDEHIAPPPTTVIVHGLQEADDQEAEGTRMSLRRLSSRRAHQIAPLNVRGSEFGQSSTAHLPLPPLPPPPAGSARRVSSLHLVPRLEGKCIVSRRQMIILTAWLPGSWKALPRLGPRLPDGFYSVVPPPHSEDWKEWWRTMAQLGQRDVPVGLQDRAAHPAEPAPPSRPSTPPSQIFSISNEVLRLVHDARTKFDEIVRVKGQMEERAQLHMNRSDAAKSWPDDDRAVDGSSVRVEDISLLWASISEVNLMLARLSEVFKVIPAVPVNWTAVLELLTQVGELRDLYKVSWERFASLEEDVRPIRAEMQRICYRIAEVQDRLDEVSNEAVAACEPLIHNLYSQIDNRLTVLERRDPTPLPHVAQTGDVLKILSRLSDRVEQLERAAEADDFRTRIDGYISRYMADRGVTDRSLRQLGSASTDTLSARSAGSSVSHVLHTVYPTPLPGISVASHVTGGLPAIPSSSVHSAAAPAPATVARMPVPVSTHQNEPPVDANAPGTGASSTIDLPEPSMVSRMHKRSYGRGSSSARHGG